MSPALLSHVVDIAVAVVKERPRDWWWQSHEQVRLGVRRVQSPLCQKCAAVGRRIKMTIDV